MANDISTVGAGHASPDYATLTLWNAAKGSNDPGVGFFNVAECLGDCGSSANINGAHIRGYQILGQVAYDGTNDSALASVRALTLTTANGLVEDMNIINVNQFGTALMFSAADTIVRRSFVHAVANTSGGGGHIVNFSATTNTGREVQNCVVDATNDNAAVNGGFNRQYTLRNTILYNSTGTNVTGSSANQNIIDCYSCGANTADYGTSLELSFAASSDGTGSAGLQNITIASALVDVANNDFRSISGGPLDGTGSGGGLIGAFLQAGGAGGNDSVISAAMPGMISSALLSGVVPSSSVSISSVMPSMVSSFLASQSEPVYDSQIISDMPSMSSSLLVSQSVPAYSLQSSSDMPSMSSALVASNLAAGFNAQVSSDMPSMVSALDSDHDLPEFSVSVSSLMPSMTASISLSQIVSGNAANIDSIMPSMGSSAAIIKVNPQLSAQILSDMPSMNSAAGLSRIVPGNELSASSLMPSMQSSLLLGVSEPVDLTLSVLSTMPSMQSALTLINGDIQRIDNIALSFAVDGISVEYKQSNMNISYGE